MKFNIVDLLDTLHELGVSVWLSEEGLMEYDRLTSLPSLDEGNSDGMTA